jgi:predicted nucleotidyltransferase
MGMVKNMVGIAPIVKSEPHQKIIQWFFAYPNREIMLNQLSLELGISKATASREVVRLAKENFLKKKVFGKTWIISCNQKHQYFQSLKVGYNLAMISDSGILEELHKKLPNSKVVVLFGSYRKGDDVEESDIDIAVELADDELRIISLGIVSQLGYRKNVPVNLHVFSRGKIDLNLFANIANGIVLEGFLEVRP